MKTYEKLVAHYDSQHEMFREYNEEQNELDFLRANHFETVRQKIRLQFIK